MRSNNPRWSVPDPRGDEIRETVRRFEPVEFGARRIVPSHWSPSIKAFMSDMAYHHDEAVIDIRVHVYAEVVQDETAELSVSVEYPANPFEMIKEAVLPGWARRLWPVRMKKKTETATYRFKNCALYPDWKYVPYPEDMGKPVLRPFLERVR